MDGKPIRFVGSFDNLMDAKNRVALPAKHRQAVPDDVGPKFSVVPGWTTVPCLWVYPKVVFARYFARFEDERFLGDEEMQLYRGLLLEDYTEEIPDVQGRILLTERQRRHAGLVKKVDVIGNADRLELWSPERRAEWMGMLSLSPEEREATWKQLYREGKNRAEMAKRFFAASGSGTQGGAP